MKTFRMVSLMIAILLAAVFTFGGLCQAASDYPNRPVQVLCGFPPGGPTDLTARALFKAAEPLFPKPFTVVNKTGGGSVIAANDVVKAAPDGYTLGAADGFTYTCSPHLLKNPPYKGPEDISPIINYYRANAVFIIRADSPFKNMKEIIKYAKENPGKLRIGHAGIGSGTHIHLLSLTVLNVPVTDVPFTGAAPAITALLGGHVDGIVMHVLPTLPHVRSGKLRYVGIFADEPSKAIPELVGVPTLKQLGYNTVTDGSDFFIGAPKGTPSQIVDMLYNVFLKAEKTEFFQDFCQKNVVGLTYKGPAELKKQLNENYAFYKDFLPKIGMVAN
jgi:tripartite-type tricarboxylate transporter receptor subunit TctC